MNCPSSLFPINDLDVRFSLCINFINCINGCPLSPRPMPYEADRRQQRMPRQNPGGKLSEDGSVLGSDGCFLGENGEKMDVFYFAVSEGH